MFEVIRSLPLGGRIAFHIGTSAILFSFYWLLTLGPSWGWALVPAIGAGLVIGALRDPLARLLRDRWPWFDRTFPGW